MYKIKIQNKAKTTRLFEEMESFKIINQQKIKSIKVRW